MTENAPNADPSQSMDPADVMPMAGEVRKRLQTIQEFLDTEHTALYAHDAANGVLHLIDQAQPWPPLSDLWSRIFTDEKLPTTEVVRTGVPSIGEFDDAPLAYAGLNIPPTGLGRLASIPLSAEGHVVGMISAAGCRTEAGLDEILGELAPELDFIAAELARSLTTVLARIARRIFALPEPAASPDGPPGAAMSTSPPDPAGPPAPFHDSAQIRAMVASGTFCWRLAEDLIHFDAIGMSIFGSVGEYTGDPTPLLSRIHRDDFPLFRRTLAKAVGEDGSFAIECRVLRSDESVRWIETRGRVTTDDTGRQVMVGILTDTTGRPTWLQLASGPADAMADGLVVIDRDWKVIYANETSARMAELGRAELVGRHISELLVQVDPEVWEPKLRRAVEGRQQVTFEVYFPTVSRWYEVRAGMQSSGVAIYLRDIHSLRATADRDRTRALRREKSSSFAAALGGTLGVDDVILVFEQQLATLFEADGVAMHVAADGRLRLIAAVGYTAAGLAQLRTLDLDGLSPMADAARTQITQVYPSAEKLVAKFPHLAEACTSTNTGALLVVPLGYEDVCLGIVCVRFDEPREFTKGRLAFVERTCAQLTQALYRAHRYDDELSLAARLRDDVLARPLYLVPGLELATEYRAAGVGLAVGGDWFDVIPLTRGRVGLLVGDVEGHDAHAVGGMSTVRTAVRAYAYEGYGPAAILGRVNRLVTELDPDLLATCCYAELNQATGFARIARAGHPAPVLRSADGRSALVDLPAGLPLGVDPGEAYRAVLTPVPSGSLLALYSDGLVESRTMSIDLGTDRLIETMNQFPELSVTELAHQIIAQRLNHAALGDDVTLLLAKCT